MFSGNALLFRPPRLRYCRKCHLSNAFFIRIIPTDLLPNEVKIQKPLPSSRSRQITDQPRFLVQISGKTMGDVIKVGLLNVDGYYDSLLHLFDTGVRQGFIEDSARHIVVSAETAAELLRKMEVRWIAFSCACGISLV
ncbi:hypothetical protein B296_00040619 [Ensete ventricosum]|uniref:cytokinin riboside 5'-monophosphate phosphoribohydrolase n=1 Tax=Ensete ventricosum TaxID=4639 RepID=A0A426ZPP9_ENSVE|nr:hypothetical protein B296_00040619 [Ensete ventricosum]